MDNSKNNFKHNTTNYILALTFACLLLSITSCNHPNKEIMLKIDMSIEHDAGRFSPEKGDKISIAGNFNGWEKNALFLDDKNGDWIFTIPLKSLVQADSLVQDTLKFKFIHVAGINRQVANQGWEDIEERHVLVSELINNEMCFVFNEIYDERVTREITFTVGMSTQKLLEFFKPEEGDKVLLTGNFMNWDENGIILKDVGNNIFSATIPVKYYPWEPIEFKYRLLSKRKVFFPNDGWETVDNRKLFVDHFNKNVPFYEFNDQRGVIRFIVNTEKFEQEEKFNPFEGDILQILLKLDGNEKLTDILSHVKKQEHEITVQIPLSVMNIKWQLMKNYKYKLTKLKEISISQQGQIVRN